jgi:hypothetical protein
MPEHILKIIFQGPHALKDLAITKNEKPNEETTEPFTLETQLHRASNISISIINTRRLALRFGHGLEDKTGSNSNRN